jgi:hypothetical protein
MPVGFTSVDEESAGQVKSPVLFYFIRVIILVAHERLADRSIFLWALDLF